MNIFIKSSIVRILRSQNLIRPIISDIRHANIRFNQQTSSDAALKYLDDSNSSKPSHLDPIPQTSVSSQGFIGKISGKLLFGYICKICSTRQFRNMSKDAYENGVVIVKCKGCHSLHLIADHLGWFDSTKKMGNIEAMLRNQGREGDVKRLNPEDTENLEWLPAAIQEADLGIHSTVNNNVQTDAA